MTHKAEVQKVKLLKITRRNRKRKTRKEQAITAGPREKEEVGGLQGRAQGAVVAVVVYVQRAAFEGRARCTKSAQGAKINKALRLLG